MTRIGRNVNIRYKRITTSIGLQTSRRAVVQANASIGNRYMTFTGVEKIIGVSDRSTGTVRMLAEMTVEEINERVIGTGLPSAYAVNRMGAGSVEIYLDTTPQTAFEL